MAEIKSMREEMRFFTDIMHDIDVSGVEIKDRFDAYYVHLESIRPKLPQNVYEFASAPWHYDDGTKGLHDSWVESLTIEEPSTGVRNEERRIEIRLKLLSAFHDRQISLWYKDVRKYKLQTPAKFKYLPSFKTGHGDWLYDEFDVSRAGSVIHKVRFSRGSTWYIECADMEFNSTSLNEE